MAMSDFKDPNKVQNVYVKIGKPLTPSVPEVVTYHFQLITFQDTQVQVANRVNQTLIRNMMKQTEKLLIFETMETSSPSSSAWVINSVWSQQFSKYSSGIVTKNYTIIPQVVIKQIGDFVDNGISGDDKNEITTDNMGAQWSTSDIRASRSVLSDDLGFINTSHIKFFEGEQTSVNKKITYSLSERNLGSFAFMIDSQGALQFEQGMENPGVEIVTSGSSIFISRGSQVVVQVNGGAEVTGSVTTSTVGYNVPHIKNNTKLKPITIFVYPIYNSLVVSSNLSGSIKDKTGVAARISNATLNAIAKMKPKLSDFPGKYMQDGRQSISVNGDAFNFDSTFKVSWINSYGAFCYCPITFAQKASFAFYFIGQLKDSKVDGVTVTYDAVPIFDNNGSGFSMNSHYEGKEYDEDSKDMQSIWKFAFDISGDVDQISPGEMFGFIKVQIKSGKPSEIINKDGEYKQSFNRSFLKSIGCSSGKRYSDSSDGWSEYITNVQTSVNFEGMSGSITLDKYAMKSSLTELPEQNIGAITLQAFGGAYDTFNGNNVYTQEKGLIFKGYALQTSNNVTENSATMNVTLVGVQKKLDDIKMINAPFWDGDKLFGGKSSVISYFRSYTGCHLQKVDEFLPSTYILPRSDNYQKPAVNFSTGTSCLQALRTVAEKCDLKMVVQPNGRVYFYETDDQFIPYYIKTSPVIKSFDETQIISFDISPSLQNRFNSFATMGFLTTSTPGSQFDPTQVGTIPGILLDSAPPSSGFDFPWSRIISQVIPGWLTADQLKKQHAINKKRGKAQVYQGSVTVAGISNLFLYDKIKIGGLTYFITGINQNIDLQNKTWTTQLNIARYYS